MRIEELQASPCIRNMRAALAREGAFVTEYDVDDLFARATCLTDPGDLARLGVALPRGGDVALFVTDPTKPLGAIRIVPEGPGCAVIIDNARLRPPIEMRLHFGAGHSCQLIAGGPADIVNFENIFLRGRDQWMFWGAGATSVRTMIEIEGDGHGIAIGDDGMFSTAVTIRNHAMHALFDPRTGAIRNGESGDIIIEQHVWLSDGAMLIGDMRLGYGGVVGAHSFVNADVPPRSAAVGTPAKVLPQETSWSRLPGSVSEETIARLARLARLPRG